MIIELMRYWEFWLLIVQVGVIGFWVLKWIYNCGDSYEPCPYSRTPLESLKEEVEHNQTMLKFDKDVQTVSQRIMDDRVTLLEEMVNPTGLTIENVRKNAELEEIAVGLSERGNVGFAAEHVRKLKK